MNYFSAESFDLFRYIIYIIFVSSANMLEIAAALSAVTKIVSVDMIPAVIGDVSTTVLCDTNCYHFVQAF